MTYEEFASAVAVIKNALLLRKLGGGPEISPERCAIALWNLLDETGFDSLHYTPGASRAVDEFIAQEVCTKLNDVV